MANDTLTLGPPANPYAALMDEESAGAEAQFKASASLAVTSNPDKIAQQRRVAGYLGMPPAAVEALPEQSEQEAKVKRLAEDTARAPSLRAKYTDQDFARLAHDDSGVLSGIESAVRSFMDPQRQAAQKPAARIMSGQEFGSEVRRYVAANPSVDFDTARRLLMDGTRIEDGPLMGESRGPAPTLENIVKGMFSPARFRSMSAGASVAAADAMGFDPGPAIRRYEVAKSRAALMDPEFETATGRGLYGGGVSAVQNSPGIALSILSGNPLPGLLMAGGGVSAESYGKYRARGGTPGKAAAGAALEGGIEAATELLPMGFMVDRLGKAGASEFIKGLLAREVPGEQLATLAQDAVDTAIANPDKTWADYIAERPAAAYQTLLATLVQSGVMGAVNVVANRVTGFEVEARRAEETAERAQEFAGLIEQSKLRERAPDKLNEFVAEIAESGETPTEFYIDAQQLANSLNQSAVSIEQLRAFAPAVADQMEAAKLVPGADIRVPLAEFAATPTEVTTGLIDHLRENPQAMSRAEAQTFLKEAGPRIQTEVETAMADQGKRAESAQAVDQLRQEFQTQLDAVGKFRPEVNKAYATMLGSFYATQAERAGVPLAEFAKTYGLRVAGKDVAGRQRLEQGPADDAASALLELGKSENIFRYPKSASQDVAEIATEKGLSLAPVDRDSTDNDEWMLANSTSEGPDTESWLVKTKDGRGATLTRNGGEVYINVSAVGEGGGGSAIYDLAANYAYNHGLVFVGDPHGVSPAAMRRRLENMLSSAIKYGTTDHIDPHPDQLIGDPRIGVPPLRWTKGDTAGNILSMVEASVAATESTNPVATSNVRFDAATQSFVDGENNPLDDADVSAMLGFDARKPRTGQAGRATLQRNALFRAVLSGPDARRAFLESIRRGQGRAGESLGGTFYQGERGALSFGDDITASPSVIALLEGADLSTFLHESGHFFLEVQADLAGRIQRSAFMMEELSEGERQIVADMEKILGWFGVKGDGNITALDAWSLMTLEQKREHHETWARGFEKYVMEGKAPSQELQALFSKFRAWLVSVYKTLAGLDVKLSDEVRQVMDRMLASDTAIAEAQAADAMGPLFESPDKAGMTPEEFASYQALGERQTATAAAELDARLLKDMKWLSRARGKAMKAAQAEADAQRKEVEREVRAEVMSQPVYQAWQFLTAKSLRVEPGIQAAETIDTARQSGKLRTSLLKESHPDLWKTMSERKMTSDTNGMDPDIVAEIIPGFSSGDEMLQALAAAAAPNQVIEELTDREMLQRFGDITSQEALERAADEAVHNEMRARVVSTELQALEKAGSVRAGPRSTIAVMARAAKDYAYQVIARQRVRDLRPSQYSAAQARSAKLAQQAMGKSLEEAAMHKRNELINTYASRAASDALAEVKAAQAYFRTFDKRIKGIDADYQDQIDQMLERFDFKQATLKEIDRRKSFAEWYAAQEEAGIAPNVPDELIENAARKSFKDMTVEELRGLRDTIKQIEHQGRLKNRLLLSKDKREFDAVAQEMTDSIVAHGGDARPVELEGPNKVVDWFAGLAASHRKLASLFRQMDGNKDQGPMYEQIGRAMNERSTMEDVMIEQATVALRDLYAPLLKLRGGITGHRSKLFIPEINASLTRGGRLAVALNWGNEANRQRIMDGDRWSEDQVRAILKTLTPAELEFVNGVWAYIDTYWEEIAAKEKRLTGVEPEKVEAVPFTAIAADGSAVAMRGGYYPLKYDTDRSDRADTQEAAQAAKEMMQGAITRATTRRGHTKERLKEVKRAVRKDLNVITQHVTQVVHDLAWHEWLIDTNKFLSDEGVVSAIRAHYGRNVLKTLRDGVLGIATADAGPQTHIDQALLMVRSNVTRATMGASLTTAFLQPFGLTQSMVRIGGRHVLRGVARWGGDAVRMESTVGWIQGKSEFMRLRAKTFNRELREIRGAVAGKSKTMRVVDAGLFVMMQKMQMVADVPTWVGQYEKSLAEGLDDDAAVAMADRAVLESQGGGATKDLAEVQRKHPMLTQFYSYFSVTLNLAAEQTAATDFKNPAAVTGWLGDMALLMVVPAILPSLILFALKGGDDDEKGLAKRMAEWQIGYLMGLMVGVRELSGAVAGFDYAGPPVGRLAVDTGRAGKQVLQGEVDEPAVMSLINLMGSAFGIPTVQALRSYKGWKAWDEGKEGAGPMSILFGPPPKD